MKKIIIFALGMSVLFVACSSDIEVPASETNEAARENISSYRSAHEAMQEALRGIQMIETDEADTRCAEVSAIHRKPLPPIIKTRPSTRSTTEDTLMYVFNFEDNMGYALVDANRNRPALIAVTESGSYVDGDTTNDWSTKTIQSLVNGYLYNINGSNDENEGEMPSREEINERRDTTITTIEPRIKVQWGQGYPFNSFAPNHYAGCGITAMLQVMSYFRHPDTLAVNFPNAGVSSIELDWNTFNHHIRYGNSISHYDDSIVSYSKHQDMGRLARQLGKNANAVYDSIGTGTTFSNVMTCLTNLGYTCPYIGDYSSTSPLYNSLNLGSLILMGGDDPVENAGHFWIVDGGIHYEIVTTRYGYNHSTHVFHIISITTTHRYYNHVNWGWDGHNNGFFLEGIFDTDNYTWADGTENGAHYNFNTSLQKMAVHL